MKQNFEGIHFCETSNVIPYEEVFASRPPLHKSVEETNCENEVTAARTQEEGVQRKKKTLYSVHTQNNLSYIKQ